jgi:hypothetical protein
MIKRYVTGEVTYNVRRRHDTRIFDVKLESQLIGVIGLGAEHVEIKESAVPI